MNDIELLEQHAVDAAINLRWEDAIRLNNEIIKLDTKNESAYLRLGFIYLQQKDIVKAKKFYSKALRLQPKNSVALQNLERISVLENEKVSKHTNGQVAFDPDLFIETAGKTKMVALTNLGQKNVLAVLTIGQQVCLKEKKRRVEVRTSNGEYIGTLPDDLSRRIIFFIKAKSEYVTYVKESTLTRVIVFIKEEKKGRTVMHQISFPQNIQKKLDESTVNEDKEEAEGAEEQEEHMDAWEKMVNETPSTDDKELLIDIHSDDLDDEE